MTDRPKPKRGRRFIRNTLFVVGGLIALGAVNEHVKVKLPTTTATQPSPSVPLVAHSQPVQKQFDFKGIRIGAPATPADILQTLGVECGNGQSGMIICNGRVTIADGSADMNLVIGSSGNVQRISLRFFSINYDNVAHALRSKFGAPDEVEKAGAWTGAGVPLDQVETSWHGTGTYVKLRRYAGNTRYSSLSYLTDEDLALAQRVMNERANDL